MADLMELKAKVYEARSELQVAENAYKLALCRTIWARTRRGEAEFPVKLYRVPIMQLEAYLKVADIVNL
jgi:hypothetical protein